MKSLIMFCVLFATTAGFAATNTMVNVDQLNQKLKKSNAGWVAKDNWVNQLSKKEVQHMLGLKDAPKSDVEFATPERRSRLDLPVSLDWRNKDGKNWVSPILNQANCGSCVAFAAIGVMETQLNISSILPTLNMRLSPQNLFSCGGGACDYGWYPSGAAQFLMQTGVTDEACMPYLSGATGEDVACNAACSDSTQRTYKISNYSTPSRSARDLTSVKEALQKGPLMTTLTVYADFIPYAGGVYKHTTGSALGGHAVSIVGYDDNDQAFIIRNSWSEDWGEKGFARVAYSDISGIGNSTWSFEAPATTGSVSILNSRDYSYFTGAVQMNAISTYNNTNTVTLSIFDKTNQSVWSSSCTTQNCVGAFDSATLADGRYEVQAYAMDAQGGKIDASIRQFFYVVNQKPNLAVSFTGVGVDLTQPIKGRIVFNVKSSTGSSIPLSSLEFHYKNAAGVDKVRTSDIVLDNMTLGWRTPMTPNGNYEIWMVGRMKSNNMDISVESAHQNIVIQN